MAITYNPYGWKIINKKNNYFEKIKQQNKEKCCFFDEIIKIEQKKEELITKLYNKRNRHHEYVMEITEELASVELELHMLWELAKKYNVYDVRPSIIFGEE